MIATSDAIKSLVLLRLRQIMAETACDERSRVALLRGVREMCRQAELVISELIDSEVNDHV